ncbi:hypothetical protein LZ017_09430 [Pelomonas sp. CA6]|uniref:hypothetical protein n=1 Tax=Pelomonas sp. CA6 TaxID=2907999 RepID=UPI001F4BE574|nr:hypothetical protein [Pelomonas sp. CA6]MCH7343598.1 hypothetical protein [Pelomonas sp. CA6]
MISKHTSLKALLFGIGVTLAFALSAQHPHSPAPQVVKLERVVIEGKRSTTPVQQLPRVELHGHRVSGGPDQQLASVATATCSAAAALC